MALAILEVLPTVRDGFTQSRDQELRSARKLGPYVVDVEAFVVRSTYLPV